MLTTGRVDARVRQSESLDGLPTDDVRFNYFVHIGQRHATVPNRVRIDDQIRSVLALIKTAGLIGPHFPFQPPFRQLLLE